MCNVRCKLLKNLCMHGGNYSPVFPTDYTTPRYKCNCVMPGYTGNHRQNVGFFKSYYGYKNGTRVPGKYKVFDNNMKLYQVFCDFDLNPTMTWTLVLSYELQNENNFRQSFLADSPVNENTISWDSYRIQLCFVRHASMTLKEWSTPIAFKLHVDILTYTDQHPSHSCPLVDFIDIRG